MIDIFILLITIIISWKLYFSKYGDIEKLPGPTSFELFKIMQSKSETLDLMRNASKKYGGIVKLWIKPFAPMVLVSDPDVVLNILKSPYNLRKTAFYGILAVFFGEDLTTQRSLVEWKHDRKEMSPCLTTKNLRNSTDLLDRNMDGLFTNIRNKLNQPVDIGKLISLYTITSSLELTTRRKYRLQEMLDYKYVNLLTEAFACVSERTNSFILQNDFFFKFSKYYQKGLKAANTLKNLVDLDKSQSNGTCDVLDVMINNNVPDDRKHEQLVALLVGTGQHNLAEFSYCLTNEKLIRIGFFPQESESEVGSSGLVLVFEKNDIKTLAHDTTKSSLSFTIFQISKHPEIQKKLLQETIDLLGTDKLAPITYDTASRMNYMRCVINETLRLYPTIPIIQRTLGTEIKANGLVIPRETDVTISIVSMHRDERYFENALKFDPDRFLPENRHKIPAGAFSPFSAGPRDCFGKHYAMLKISCTIAKIIRNFEILPVKDHELDVVLDFISTSLNGFPVVFRERGHLEQLQI